MKRQFIYIIIFLTIVTAQTTKKNPNNLITRYNPTPRYNQTLRIDSSNIKKVTNDSINNRSIPLESINTINDLDNRFFQNSSTDSVLIKNHKIEY